MPVSAGFSNPDQSFTGLDPGFRGGTLRYPHPFFDVAQTYLPITIKHLFRWCHIYYQLSGLVNSVVNKMAQYPVTKLQYKAKDVMTEEVFEELFDDHMNLEAFLIECGVDYYTYGNCYVSIHYPITKYLICKQCKHQTPIDRTRYKFQSFKFHMESCPNCKRGGEAEVKDIRIPAKHKIRLVRWDPMDIDVFYNQVTGESTYVLGVPAITASRIREGNPLFLNETPQVFIDAVRRGHRVLLSPYNIFHMKRANIAGKDMGIGSPLVLPVLKDLYLMQVLKKSQEAIAHEHIVPLRIIHPAASGPGTDPVGTLDLSSWQSVIRTEIARWRQDPNYTPIVPLPLGFQYMGGQGKSLLLTNELKQLGESIIAGMGVPIEFAFGGSSFSGSSVSLRMLENQFMRHQTQMTKLVKFIISSISDFLKLDPAKAEFTSLRTADDVQRKSLLMQMNQANKVSNQTLMGEFNLDPEEEQGRIELEMKATFRLEQQQFTENAENQGKAQVIQARYEAEAQAESLKTSTKLQENQMNRDAGAPTADSAGGGSGAGAGSVKPGNNLSLDEKQLKRLVNELSRLNDGERAASIQKLKMYVDPQTIKSVNEYFSRKGHQEAGKPLPSQRPPRRGPKTALI